MARKTRRHRASVLQSLESLESRIVFNGTAIVPMDPPTSQELSLFDSFVSGLKDVGTSVLDTAADGLAAGRDLLDSVIELTSDVTDEVQELTESAAETINDWAVDAAELVEDALGIDTAESVDAVLGNIVSHGETWTQTAESLINDLFDAVSDRATSAIGFVTDAVEATADYGETVCTNLADFESEELLDLTIGAVGVAAEAINLPRDAYESLSDYFGPSFNARIITIGVPGSTILQPVLAEHDSFGITPFAALDTYESWFDNAEARKRDNVCGFHSHIGQTLVHYHIDEDYSLGESYGIVMALTTIYVIPYTGIPAMAYDVVDGVHDDNFERTGAGLFGLGLHLYGMKQRGRTGASSEPTGAGEPLRPSDLGIEGGTTALDGPQTLFDIKSLNAVRETLVANDVTLTPESIRRVLTDPSHPLHPFDSSPLIVPEGLGPEAPVGELSANLSVEVMVDLFRPGRNLTGTEIQIKADLLRHYDLLDSSHVSLNPDGTFAPEISGVFREPRPLMDVLFEPEIAAPNSVIPNSSPSFEGLNLGESTQDIAPK